MAFRVTNIVDGNTIQVAGWKWQDVSGTKVRILGYSVAGNDPQFNNLAKDRLTTLLKDKEVELRNATKIENKETLGEAIIYCSVYLNDVDVSKYFPELKHS